MTYQGRVYVAFGPRPTRLERLRAAELEFDRLKAIIDQSEQLWRTSDNSRDELLHACIQVTSALADFCVNMGLSLYAKQRINDMMVALSELISGRHSVLLSPSPVHAGKFSPTDLMQQAVAQVSVDALRRAGAGATEARTKVSRLFDKHRLPRFSESKLRHLNSRLRGAGCSQDEAYDMYLWAKAHAEEISANMGIDPSKSIQVATKFADTLISLAKHRDHRPDFFPGPREDSSQVT